MTASGETGEMSGGMKPIATATTKGPYTCDDDFDPQPQAGREAAIKQHLCRSSGFPRV